MTSIANTGHVMKSLVFKNDTSLYDIILKALKETKRQTGRNYQVYSAKGKMGLRAWPDPEDVWVIESGVNLIGYQYSTSIEETATRVKMRTSVDEQGKNKKKGSKSDIVVIEQDKAGQSQYGILQHVETVTGQINQPQLQKRAKVRLAEKKGVKQEVKSIQALGIPELQSGLPIYLKIPEINIKKTYWIDQDKHEFNGVKHTMTIDVVEKNSMPKGDQA